MGPSRAGARAGLYRQRGHNSEGWVLVKKHISLPRSRMWRTRAATALAAAGALVMSMGVVALSARASATDTNQPGTWETLPGETCTKVDDRGAQSGGYTIDDAPTDGYVYSKIILKKGSGDSQGEENTVIYKPVEGQTYFHLSGSGYSHVILALAQVPENSEGVPGHSAGH